MGSQQNRFPLQHERRKRWGGCFGALSCFRTQKGGKRIAPTSRVVEGNSTAAQSNGPHVTGSGNQVAIPGSHILAPPSSPASFSNSALPSTAPSPNCFLSANSPGGPTSTMFATGPYAHETQLVSPPVFSAFTTEPSTAPLTPPPELAHLTTPSSPDVPFARFFASSADLRSAEKTKVVAGSEFQSTYSPYPGSPASSVISPISRASGEYISSSYPERQFAPQWDQSVSSQNGKYQRTDSGRLFVQDTDSASMVSRDTNFFCPATFAQYYLDPSSTNGGRLSVSKDSDVHPAAGSGHQNRQNRSPKQDAEELEAYRASFGFSADEIITTPQYVEISNVMDESFTMSPCASNKVAPEETLELPSANEGQKPLRIKTQASAQNDIDMKSDFADGCEIRPRDRYEDLKFRRQSSKTARSTTQADHALDDDTENILSKFSSSKISRKYQVGLSCSDAEVEYRRGRSLRESKSNSAWQD